MSSIVYRIENESGKGAYSAGVDWYAGDCDYPGDERVHPGPMSDSGLADVWSEMYDKEAYFFGFRDEAQMRAWFYSDEWLRAMKDVGLRLTLWEVEDGFAHYGHSQAVFMKDKARIIETRELI